MTISDPAGRSIATGAAILAFVIAFFSFSSHESYRGRECSDEDFSNGRSGAMEALEFWSASRAYPENDIPRDTYFKEFLKATRETKASPRLTDAITLWRSIGPNNLSGRAISVAVNPQNHNTLYVGSASGGLWRSHTGGLGGDWERVATGFPVLGVSAIVVNPNDSNTIYIGTGEVYRYQAAVGGLVVRTTRGSYGMGILKTTNSGLTWTKCLDWSTEQQRGIQAVKLNPLNPNTVYAATTEGFCRSTDAGQTWNFLIMFPLAQDFVVNPLDTNLIILSTGNFEFGAGIRRTSDGGETWSTVSDLPGFSGKALLESFAANPNVVYADIADSTTGVGSLWKSTDFGLNWTCISPYPGIYGVQGWYSHFIAAHPSDSSQLFHFSVDWQKSTDGGATFHGAGFESYPDHHAYAHDPVDPNILYVVNDDGPYRSTNFGETFTYIGTNLPTGQFYNGFSNSATDSLLALGQVQDHIPGYIYLGSTSWGRSASDEVGWTAIDQTNDNLMYVINRSGSSVAKSTNRGASFFFTASLGTFGAWNSPLVVSASNPGVIYAAKTRVYKSTNAAVSFSATNGNVDIDGNPAISLAVSATSPDTALVGLAPYVKRGEVFRTTNGGTTWTNVTGTLPDRYPLDLAFDPRDSRTAYVTFGGFGTGHIYRTTNTGNSWVDISGTLPNVPTGAVLVDPANSHFVYVGNDIGVYVSTNAGSSWSWFSEGLPEAILVSDLSYTPSNRTLRVTTHGNGVFERKLDNVLPALTLLTPNGGEMIEANSPCTITWGAGLVNSVSVEYTTDNGASWNPIASNVPASSGGIKWTPPFDLTTQGRVRIVSLENPSLADASDAPFTIFYDGVIRSVRNGWNLVSLSVVSSDPRSGVMFPSHYGSMYDYISTGYRKRDSLETERGYWAKFLSAQPNGVKGATTSSMTVSLESGWNLFGSLSVPISTSQISSEPAGNMVSNIFTYDGSKYVRTDSILPGYGYWVRALAPGAITLSSATVAAKPEAGQLPVPPNSVTITDKEGRSQVLYVELDPSTDARQSFALPPVPPAGAFDIRFSSNSTVEYVRESRTVHIALQGVSSPISVSWNFRDAGLSMALPSHTGRPLSGSGSLTFEKLSDGILAVHFSRASLPSSFALLQNFPNPFNPSTEIRYELAVRDKVSLKIYDLLGKEIATLVSETQEAGHYNVTWDATGMPSGIYVCRLTSGPISSSRKLLLVK